jgi:hypothetical protein
MAEHLAKRKELWAAREAAGVSCPNSLSDGSKSGPQHGKQFAADTADKTGTDKRNINKSLNRAEAIPDNVRDLIRGTNLDTSVYLDELPPITQIISTATDAPAMS